MSDSSVQTDKPCIEQKGTVAVDSACRATKGLSMHEDVPVWYDCCSCEVEPYWLELYGEPVCKPPGDDTAEGQTPGIPDPLHTSSS